jgi:hypothetical protein
VTSWLDLTHLRLRDEAGTIFKCVWRCVAQRPTAPYHQKRRGTSLFEQLGRMRVQYIYGVTTFFQVNSTLRGEMPSQAALLAHVQGRTPR